jgi:hypothetical protein
MQDEDKIIIAGYASVEVIDSQGELIPLPVLKDAWEKFKANKYFATGSLMHTNIPVIRILDEYKDSKGQVWKSGVDDTGLFIVAEVRNDIEKGKQTIELIKIGQLTGFSIAGEALASSTVCEGKCYTRIDKMELHEIAVVDRPANQPSVFTIVKSEGLRKLEELTSLLPNLIISPGVVKIAGSIAELGKGHDFDLLISASEGSFVDRAAQTRIFNELRKIGREDLWKNIHLIHEPEGLGPFTDHMDLYDLVLLRSCREKVKMVKSDQKIEDYDLDRKGIHRYLQGKVQKFSLTVESILKQGEGGGQWITVNGRHIFMSDNVNDMKPESLRILSDNHLKDRYQTARAEHAGDGSATTIHYGDKSREFTWDEKATENPEKTWTRMDAWAEKQGAKNVFDYEGEEKIRPLKGPGKSIDGEERMVANREIEKTIQKRNIEKLSREEIEKELNDLFAERKRLMNTLYPEVKIDQVEKDRMSQRLDMIDVEVRAYQEALGEAIIGKSMKKLDEALSTLRLNGRTITS